MQFKTLYNMESWHRPLTGLEQWSWLFDQAAVLNFVIVARVSGRFDRGRLRTALNDLANYYPNLTARIEPGRLPHFVAGAGQINLEIEQWLPDAWQEITVREINSPFETEPGPLVRAHLLDGTDTSDLLLTFNHVLGDGMSGILIMKELLELHAGRAPHESPQPDVLNPPLKSFFTSRLKACVVALKMFWVSRRMMPIPPERWVPVQERHTGLITVQLDGTFMGLLAAAARLHHTSVHGAFVAAVLLAIEQDMRNSNINLSGKTLGCATPVDLRRQTDMSPEAIGSLLSGVVSSHKVHRDTSFWDLAVEVSQTIRSAVESGDLLALARFQDMTVPQVRNLEKTMAAAERFNRTAAIVTNLGRIDLGTSFGPLKLERIGAIVSNNANAAASLVLSAVTIADSTSLNFMYAEPLLSKEKAQRLVDDILKRLHVAIL
ncbi:MAG: condensation domain-containing protein [Saprospiraceae bacterium]